MVRSSKPAHQRIDGLCDLGRMAVMRGPRGKQDHIVVIPWKAGLTCRLAQNPLAPVPENRISKSLRRNEGDTSTAAFVTS